MKILITGAAGFIGYHTCKNLIKKGHQVVGIDNLNEYYDVNLKLNRLKDLGVDYVKNKDFCFLSELYDNYKFYKLDISNFKNLEILFETEKFDIVCNLAAQAGVRYSIENPNAYIEANINGFMNILECSKIYKINHLVYASSSSVYGTNEKMPFSTKDNVDNPISIYAATKKSNELMAHTYSHLFKLPTTGLRFFTVYGPWGRPDMALFMFTESIINNIPINVFNYGNMERDFTYIDDIVEGVTRIIETELNKRELYKVYNIGNSKCEKLSSFIEEIENSLNKKALKNLLPIQPGDVSKTWADVSDLENDYNYKPNTSIKTGIKNFINWYKNYYQNN